MSRIKVVGLLAAGFAVCALLVPTGAFSAAPSLVGITDTSGTRVATVTKAQQLLASESNPANAVIIQAGGAGNGCIDAYDVPKGKALVLKTGTFLGGFGGTSTAGAEVVIQTGPICGGNVWAIAYFSPTNGITQTVSEDFGSQVVIPQNTQVDLLSSGFTSSGDAILYGYLIPAAAAPVGAAVVSSGKSLVHIHG